MNYRETITWRTDRYWTRDHKFLLALGPDSPSTNNLGVLAIVTLGNGEKHEANARIIVSEWHSSDILGNHASGHRSLLELPDGPWGAISEIELLPLT